MWDIVFEPDIAGFWNEVLEIPFGREAIGRFLIIESILGGGEIAMISWDDVGVSGVGMMPCTLHTKH